jgi:putative Mg2+ transporter-C (MgtC) family protein
MLIIEIIKLVLAFGIGSFIGEERELNHKPVGIRTLAILCVSSAFITIVSQKLYPETTVRTIAGIITGIGFLGAGTIIAHSRTVRGLTTAALTWAIAIIGIGIGLGEFELSLVAAVLIYIALILGKGTKIIIPKHIEQKKTDDNLSLPKTKKAKR